MTDANRNLLVRIVSAAVLLPVVLVLLWVGPWGTAALIGIAGLLLAHEYYAIVLKRLDFGPVLGMLASAAPPVVFALWPERFASLVMVEAIALLIALYAYYLIAGPLPEAPARVATVFTGFFYCGVLSSTVAGLRVLPHGLSWVFLVLLVTWGNDTGAYAAGRTLGRHKLYPAVSPSKTWEGFFGGMVASIAAALIAKVTFFPALTWVDAVAIGVPASILGPLGDFSESMLKRAHGVKDSGKLIPGHGGLLDRVDALLFNAPYIYLYAVLVHG
ncbi:MAG TPA: phosphatidate cytidylyltransferase [Myxococcales bacterium]|nr:phosphatidate cytidylyltransferase [Myxococcales bacterium]